MNSQENFRAKLRSAIAERALSIRAAGALCGISYPHLHRIMTGKTAPSLEICERIADALEFDLPTAIAGKAKTRLTAVS